MYASKPSPAVEKKYRDEKIQKVFFDINQADREVVKIKKTFYPEPSNALVYQEAYQNYLSLCQRLYGNKTIT